MLPYQALRDLEREWQADKHDPLFADGHFAIYPGVFVGGPRSGLVPFFIADAARIEYLVVYHPDDPPEAIRQEIADRVHRAARVDAWLNEHPPALTWVHHWPASKVEATHPIVAATCTAHLAATGRPAEIHGFAAVEDTTFLTSSGIPAISYGPGDLRRAHGVNEHVDIDELITACKTYALLAIQWCGLESAPKVAT
jgi:acetylornithine deacetylase/succinyl-diaminopimelate desuccinylase-like protein